MKDDFNDKNTPRKVNRGKKAIFFLKVHERAEITIHPGMKRLIHEFRSELRSGSKVGEPPGYSTYVNIYCAA
jgi:hypothetical protein